MTSIEPELWVERPREAIAFYEAGLGATVLHLVGMGDDVVAQLAVGDARFWVSTASPARPHPRANQGATGGRCSSSTTRTRWSRERWPRGAAELAPVADEHGWRMGRIEDPAGHEWEIGRPLGTWPPWGPRSRLSRGAPRRDRARLGVPADDELEAVVARHAPDRRAGVGRERGRLRGVDADLPQGLARPARRSASSASGSSITNTSGARSAPRRTQIRGPSAS